MNSIKNKKFSALSNIDMNKITGGKWTKITDVRGKCIKLSEDGKSCAEMYMYTVTYEINDKDGAQRNHTQDVYNG